MTELVTTPTGLQYEDILPGDGNIPEKGQKVSVHYKGSLKNGKQFDSSYERGKPLEFVAGVGQVISGFDEGIMGVAIGGKRRLHIPAALGYGSRGAGSSIPPDSDLIFDIELVEIG
jgi:peptidylprolyl isomerase